jgi:hypothetical protein
MSRPSPHTTPAVDTGRYQHLEMQFGAVATQLADFIKDSKEYRDRNERDQMQIWAAIKDQGVALQSAVERLSNNTRISWPGIVATVGLVLSVSAGAAAIGNAIVESKIAQNVIRIQAIEKQTERLDDRFMRYHEKNEIGTK